MSARLGEYEVQEYAIPVAGMTLRLLGPRYLHALNDDPQVRQRSEQDGYKPYWAQPFPTAVMLAEHVIANTPLGPEPILELGAGLGLAGIALTMAGHRVVLTDYDKDALEFVRASAQLNAVEPWRVQRLDWRDPPPRQYGLIVASDVVYERRHHQAIALFLASCLKPAGRAFFSDLNRTVADEFPQALQAGGFSVEIVPAEARAIPSFDAIDERLLQGRIFHVWAPGG